MVSQMDDGLVSADANVRSSCLDPSAVPFAAAAPAPALSGSVLPILFGYS